MSTISYFSIEVHRILLEGDRLCIDKKRLSCRYQRSSCRYQRSSCRYQRSSCRYQRSSCRYQRSSCCSDRTPCIFKLDPMSDCLRHQRSRSLTTFIMKILHSWMLPSAQSLSLSKCCLGALFSVR
jgi:hypothetical protein